LAGTEEVWIHTFQTGERSYSARKERGSKKGRGDSGLGTKHRGHEFYVSPDDVKRLHTGEMILIEKRPHRVSTVQVTPAGTPDWYKPPGWSWEQTIDYGMDLREEAAARRAQRAGYVWLEGQWVTVDEVRRRIDRRIQEDREFEEKLRRQAA
jgi:hypothetical protein